MARAASTDPSGRVAQLLQFHPRCEELEPRDVPSGLTTGSEFLQPRQFATPDRTDDSPAEAAPADEIVHYAEEHGAIGKPLLTMPRGRFAVGAGASSPTSVHVYDAATNALLGTLTPFGAGYSGGARVATGDLTGDGIEDIVVGAGPGVPATVKVFDGGNLVELRAFAPYEAEFTGGVYVAVGDVTGDGRADLVTGAGDGGGPHVQAFGGRDLFPGGDVRAAGTPFPRLGFFAYTQDFRGGVTVAAGDVDGDGRDDIVTGAGPGGGPHVKAFDAADLSVLLNFFAYDPGFRGGVLVAAGDFDGDGTAEIATGAGLGGGPHVRVFDGAEPVRDLCPFDGELRCGSAVAAVDVDADGRSELIVATGQGVPPQVKVIDPLAGTELRDFPAMVPDMLGGLFVG